MEIKVAYDVTVPAYYFERFDCKSGIYRVVEEVMIELLQREDIYLNLMSFCGDDFLFSSLKAEFYIRNKKFQGKYDFFNSFRSQLGFSKAYNKYIGYSVLDELEKIPKFAPNSVLKRLIRRVLYYIYQYDVVPDLSPDKIDIFHSTYLKLPSEDLTQGIPRLITIYDLIPITAPQFVTAELTDQFKAILDSINIKRDWAICISEYTRQEFCDYTGIDPNRVFIAPLAASESFYLVEDSERIHKVCSQYGIPEQPYFLSLAAPQPRKNLLRLIQCFLKLVSKNSEIDANLVLVGSKSMGWMNDEIFQTVESCELLRSRVIFTGYIPDNDLSEVYSGATAFVFPSLYEGFGLPVLEAMQCGTPVITSNTTSLPEVLGDAGILVDPYDQDALCQAMLNLLINHDLRLEYRKKGLSRASQFTWKKCASDIASVYKIATTNH